MKRKNMRHNIDEMKTIAKDRGGLCLSDKYANVQTKLKWQCSKGHIWEAIPKNIKRGSWCGKCKNLQKLTLEEMQKIAAERSGKCLSKKYINAHTKLRWQCSNSHIWEAIPTSIRNMGSWCPKCPRSKKTYNLKNAKNINKS